MVNVLASCAVYRGFDPMSGQTNDNNIGICCFSPTHVTLRRMSKNWSSRNQNNLCEWSDRSSRGLLLQWAITII